MGSSTTDQRESADNSFHSSRMVSPSQRDSLQNSSSQRNPLLRLLDFTEGYKKLTITGCILSGFNALCSIAMLVCIWFVLRDLIAVAPNWTLATQAPWYGIAAMVFALAGLLIYFAALMCTHLSAFRAATNMRKAALRHLIKVPLGYFSSHSTGELRRIIEGATGLTEGVLAHRFPDFVGALVTPVAFLVVMFIFDWLLGLVCLIPIAVSLVCMFWMMAGAGGDENTNMMTFMKNYQDALDRMNKGAVEYVRGIPVVKVFQQTVKSFHTFRESIIAYKEFASAYVRLCTPPQVAQLVAINSTFAVLVPAGILLAQNTGDFASFLSDFLFYVIFSALTTTMMTKVMYSSQALTEAQDAMMRIEGILSVPCVSEPSSEKKDRDSAISTASLLKSSDLALGQRALQGENNSSWNSAIPYTETLSSGDAIDFESVTFSYPDSQQPVLKDITFHVPSGSTVALVGPSGGGKSTAASLVPRFWDVDSGSVRIGGIDVREIPSAVLMNQIAFVFQNDKLFKQSLADNIKAARPDATRKEIEAAARAAQCDDIISKLPEGLDTVVGTRGVYLSGGECQRIALARAILKDAPIVVLDEATAFADPENETLIQKALTVLTQGKTVLMIAHRLSTVISADCIYVIDEGKLVEEGTHEDLVMRNGLYARMWADYQLSASWRIEGKGAADVA